MRGLAAAILLVSLLGPGAARAQDTDPESIARDAEATARQRLREARVLYERGEFGEALTRFATVLESRPPRVRSADDLHDGYLHYAFTLFLADDFELAADKLVIALRIDPTYAPSPVTTRPDLHAFYLAEQEAWIAENGSSPDLLDEIFPSLQERPGALRRQRAPFLPIAGIGLRQLGHYEVGWGLFALELGFLLGNIPTWTTKFILQTRLTPEAQVARDVMSWASLATASVFWTAVVVDFVASLVLRRHYKLHPDKRPRLEAAPRLGRGPPVVTPAGLGLSVGFW
jgi:hypothetical protein